MKATPQEKICNNSSSASGIAENYPINVFSVKNSIADSITNWSLSFLMGSQAPSSELGAASPEISMACKNIDYQLCNSGAINEKIIHFP
jgi:hypothetical protein